MSWSEDPRLGRSYRSISQMLNANGAYEMSYNVNRLVDSLGDDDLIEDDDFGNIYLGAGLSLAAGNFNNLQTMDAATTSRTMSAMKL